MKHTFHIYNEHIKQNCLNQVNGIECKDKNPMQVIIKQATRKDLQNKKLWAMLRDISEQVEWYGRLLTTEEWKDVLSASLDGEQRIVPDLSGRKMVLLGKSTSKLTVSEFGMLIELAQAFGDDNNVKWRE